MESKHFKFLSIGSRYLNTNNYIIDNSLHRLYSHADNENEHAVQWMM